MHVPDDHLRREIALFRYRIIADLLLLPPGSPGIGAKLQAKAEQEHTIPGSAPASPPRPSATGCSSTAEAASTRSIPNSAPTAASRAACRPKLPSCWSPSRPNTQPGRCAK